MIPGPDWVVGVLVGLAAVAVTVAVAVAVSVVWGRVASGDERMPRPSQLRRRQLDDIATHHSIHHSIHHRKDHP